jgi:hypothetical protein
MIQPLILDRTRAILNNRSVLELFLLLTAAIERERVTLTFEKRPLGSVCFKSLSTG